jgi:hypothetical protein
MYSAVAIVRSLIPGQDYPILAEPGRNRLTIEAVALGHNRGDSFGVGVGETVSATDSSILNSPVAVKNQLAQVPASPAAGPDPYLQRVEGKVGVQTGR